MNVVRFRIKKAIDIESLCDAMAGYTAAVIVTELAEIEVHFEFEVDDEAYLSITEIMQGLGTIRI